MREELDSVEEQEKMGGRGRRRGVKCLEAEKSIFVSNISFKAPANSAGVCLFVCEEKD